MIDTKIDFLDEPELCNFFTQHIDECDESRWVETFHAMIDYLDYKITERDEQQREIGLTCHVLDFLLS